MSFIKKILGDPNKKIIQAMQPIIDEINELEPAMEKLGDNDLKAKTHEFQALLKDLPTDKLEEKLNSILPPAFAVVREAAKRILSQRHYDVQLVGGVVLHRGQIAEMKTGEGKTLVATLALYLNALAGKGAHLVTVNDYLARIGAGWMAPLYHLLGLSIGVIIHENGLIYDPGFVDDTLYDERLSHFRPVSRQAAYACDITYGTNNEFGFDYLRDNMVPSLERMVQRSLHYAIVDEIDSILIDEARTPLIISAPAEESTDKYSKFAQLVQRLKENIPSAVSLQSDSPQQSSGQAESGDYNVDEKMRAATLTEAGIAKMEKFLGVDNIYTTGGVREVHHIEQALKAHTLFKKDRDYVVKDGEVIIVDEFTGRLMHGRRYSEGLHQAIEAKEGVQVQRESQTLATITFQNFFRMYKKLAGMTGTAVTEAEEFSKIYKLETVVIPTHKPCIRRDGNDFIYRTEQGKYQAVIEDIKKRSQGGQPILVGTISIEKNELLLGMMQRAGLDPQVLNAKNHEKEAKIITDAGKPGAITIATNMAGRGVDIMLGGIEPPFASLGEATEGQAVEESDEHKKWGNDRKKVLEFGGLHVIGTERHEARRIDNQLRGRAGRQGDPGSSQFYVSMDDDLMRIFGGDRMKSIMTTLKVPEDMPIENRLISRSIESAQTKVEGNNFDIRKHLVEYDDVINKHRVAIYKKRREILERAQEGRDKAEAGEQKAGEGEEKAGEGEEKAEEGELSKIILMNVEQEIEQVVSFHTAGEYLKDWNLEEIYQVVSTIFPVEIKLKADIDAYARQDSHKLDKATVRTKIIEHLVKLAKEKYQEMTDRAKTVGLNWLEIEKAVLIRSIDTLWIEHLDAVASVRQGIGLRGYGQRDPLVEYKKEAYGLFNELNNLIQKEVVYSIFKVGAIQTAQPSVFTAPSLVDRAREFTAPAKTMSDKAGAFARYKQAAQQSAMEKASTGGETKDKVAPKARDASGNKVGRNDPCPCGSGKKYKKCHGG